MRAHSRGESAKTGQAACGAGVACYHAFVQVTADDIAQLLASAPPRQVPAHVLQAARKGTAPWSTALFGLFFGSFGMIFVVVFFPWRVADELRLAASGASTSGEVVAIQDTNMSINKRKVAEYQFAYALPDHRSGRAACYATRGQWSVGQQVTVHYAPGRPELACIEDGRLDKAGFFGSFVIIFPAVGYGMVGWFLFQRARTATLLRTGQLAEVDVLAVNPTSTRVNNRPVYAIQLSSPALGAQPVTVKRLNATDIDLAERHVADKQPVYVLYDPRRPKALVFPEGLIGS